ncbi:MAG: hypothetical protein Q7S19_03550 [bacterium]|nr:hypothetical protein [bacterium]
MSKKKKKGNKGKRKDKKKRESESNFWQRDWGGPEGVPSRRRSPGELDDWDGKTDHR